MRSIRVDGAYLPARSPVDEWTDLGPVEESKEDIAEGRLGAEIKRRGMLFSK